MRGTILGYNPTSGEGIITDHTGARVKFTRDAWKSPGEPLAGRNVDYEPAGDQATDIYLVPGSTGDLLGLDVGNENNVAVTAGIISLICAVLTFILGPFGIFTLIAAIIFGIKGKNAGRDLADKTGYYLSVAGLVISAVALAITVLALAACVGFIGLIGMSSANWV
jgi:hypothetical protein